MTFLAHVALAGWIPIAALVFASAPPARALVAALVGGWLFLPVAGYAGVTGYQDKHMVVSVGLLAAAALVAPRRLAAFRPRLVDVPMAVWCAWPYVSSLANGLGAYEGAAAVLFNTLHWGAPWLLGRVFLGDRGGIRLLATGIVIGALVYVPLCIWEVRMSPQLHTDLYGFHQHSFAQTVRSGGTFRPTVFMHHGLMVATWMASGTILAIALWRRRVVDAIGGVPMPWLVLALAVTSLLTKSTGAVVLLAAGAGVLLAGGTLRLRALVFALALATPAYMALRVLERPEVGGVVAAAASRVAAPDRVASLRFRLENEERLAAKALQRPVTGWGRYGRWIAYDEEGRAATPDGFWVIALGQFGLVGLASVTAALLLPVVRLAVRLRRARAAARSAAPAIGLAVVLALFGIDCLFNAMVNPVYFVAAGALAGVDVRTLARRRRVRGAMPALPAGAVAVPLGALAGGAP